MSMLMILTWSNVVAALTNICITKRVLQVVKFLYYYLLIHEFNALESAFFGVLFLFCFITPKHEARKKF